MLYLTNIELFSEKVEAIGSDSMKNEKVFHKGFKQPVW